MASDPGVEVVAPSTTSNPITSEVGIVIPVAVPQSNLSRHVEWLLTSEEGCDLKFLVEEKEIQ